MNKKCGSMGAVLAALSLCARAGRPEQSVTVPFVDLSRYAGQWHEIARYPIWYNNPLLGSSPS